MIKNKSSKISVEDERVRIKNINPRKTYFSDWLIFYRSFFTVTLNKHKNIYIVSQINIKKTRKKTVVLFYTSLR